MTRSSFAGDSAGSTAADIVRERAAVLERIAGVLEALLAELRHLETRASAAGPERVAEIAAEHALVRAMARRYRWFLVVQREANGLVGEDDVDRFYPIPPPLETPVDQTVR